LPDDMEIAERRRRSQALTRPELSVLLAYAKLSLNHELVQSSVPDDPYLGRELGRYFPRAIADKFPDALEHHRLRREIIATQLANSMINRGGPSLLVRIGDQTGAPPARIAAAFAAVRDSYGMTPLHSADRALDNKISGRLQLELYQAVEDLLLDRLVWFLRNVELARGLAAIVAHYREGIAAVEAALDTALPEAAAAARQGREADLRKQGVPHELARRLATLPALVAAPDIVMVAERTGQGIAEVAAIYFAAAAFFRLDHIVSAARGIVISDYFDRLALDRALDSIGDAERPPTPPLAGHRRRRRRAQGGGSLGRATHGRGRPHPARGQRDRDVRADALQALGGREPAGGFGEELSARSASCCARNTSSMPEMSCVREHHRDAVVVGGLDHLVVAHGAAGLDHGGRARLDRGEKAVGEGEERV